MADLRVDEWLPVGWNLEVKIGRNGKKETFYVDPANGNKFRSIKDIDRYLLTGKLGRNVAKSKQQDLDSNKRKSDCDAGPPKQGASKKLEVSNVSSKKSKLDRNVKMKHVVERQALDIIARAKAAQSSDGEKDYVPFFQEDSTPGGEGNQAPFCRIEDIVDLVQEEEQCSGTTYLSATAMSSLFGTQVSDNETHLSGGMVPISRKDSDAGCQLFRLGAPASQCMFPHGSWLANPFSTEADILCKVDDFQSSDMLWGSRSYKSIFSLSSAVQENQDQSGGISVQTKTMEDPGSPLGLLFADLCSDPCIDFAIKTLTGTLDPAGEEYFQMQIGSSTSIPEDAVYRTGLQSQGRNFNGYAGDPPAPESRDLPS